MIQTDGAIIRIHHHPTPVPLRLFIGFLGLGIGSVIPLAVVPHLDFGRLYPDLLLAPLFVLVPLMVGLFFLFAALAPALDLRLDPVSATARLLRRGPLGRRESRFPLTQIAAPEVQIRDSEDGPYPVLCFALPGGGSLVDADFASRAEALGWRDRIADLLASAQPR